MQQSTIARSQPIYIPKHSKQKKVVFHSFYTGQGGIVEYECTFHSSNGSILKYLAHILQDFVYKWIDSSLTLS